MESSNQIFGLDLFRELRQKPNENLIYSPLSIYFALGMTLPGASGSTADEMMKVLHWNVNDPNVQHKELSQYMTSANVDSKVGSLRLANKLFLENRYELLKSYVDFVSTFYKGGIERVDFEHNAEKSRQHINKWVEGITNEKIKDLLASGIVNEATRLVIVNAIYFKGTWCDEFSPDGKKSFHLLDGSKKDVDMMTKTKQFLYQDNDKLGFHAVQIPFKTMNSDSYSMMIVLPKKKCDLNNLENCVLQNSWSSMFDPTLFQYQNTHLVLPKFRIESQFSLKTLLQKLGMPTAFSGAADFSLMTGSRDLMIDDVIHKAFIEVDEKGAEAAAATAIVMKNRCMVVRPQTPIEFICDHPFLFVLMKNGSIGFFFGRISML